MNNSNWDKVWLEMSVIALIDQAYDKYVSVSNFHKAMIVLNI